MKCKCGRIMKECGFKKYNRRFECECGLRFLPLTERYFGSNFLGFDKWSNLKEKEFVI